MDSDKIEKDAFSEQSLSRRGFAHGLGVMVVGTTVAATPLVAAAQAKAEGPEGEQALVPTAVKTSTYTAVPGDYVPVNIEHGSLAVTLPSKPADKARVGVQIVAVSVTPGSTAVTIQCGGSDVFNVVGGSSSLTLSAQFQSVILQYDASAAIWYVQSTDAPLNEALGAAQLGHEGTIGGPGGSPLTISVATASSAYAFPETYGAVGDGITDDSPSLANWVNSGKTLALTSGKTYTCRRQLGITVPGTIINGNGATIKRPAQTTATTETSIVSGVTNKITLSSVGNPFVVHDHIVVSQGGASGTYDYAREITEVNGQQITISGTFAVSLSGTTNVYLGGYQIVVGADNCRISNVVFDGNLSEWVFTNWGVGGGVYVGSYYNAVIDHCTLNNQIADAMETDDAKQAMFAFNDVESCAGRGFSFGGSGNDLGTKVVYNRFYNCEINPNAYMSPYGKDTNDGHGAINFSRGGKDGLVHGNHIEKGITGIGGLGNSAQSGVTISDNVIRGMTTHAIEGIAKTGSDAAINVAIKGNHFYDAASVLLDLGAEYEPTALEWAIRNNLFVETTLTIQNYQQVDVSSNSFYGGGTSHVYLFLGNAGGATGVQRSTVIGNRFYGGEKAIALETNDSGLIIAQNILYNQAVHAIAAGNASGNVMINNNVIIYGPQTAPSSRGIVINGTVEVRNNIIDLGTIGQAGVYVDAQASNARVLGNTITIASDNNAVQIISGAKNTEVRDNTCSTTYSDSGTNTIKAGNRINPTAAMSGRAVLVGGKVEVSTAEVLTGDNIVLTVVAAGGIQGTLSVGTVTNQSKFVINSTSETDSSTVYWEIRH